MIKIIFDRVNGEIVYPDAVELFSMAYPYNGRIVANYSGAKPLELFFDINLKSEKLQELNQWHDGQISGMKAQYADADIEMFPLKQAEAKAWELNNTASTPTVDRIAKGDPIKRVEELNAILMKVNAVIDLSSYVGDVRSAIKACTTQEQLDAIVW